MLDRLRNPIPSELPGPLRVATLFYLLHLALLPGITATQAAFVLTIVALGVGWARGLINVSFHDVYVPLTLFALASFTSALASPDPLRSLGEAGDVWILLAFPVGLTLMRSHRDIAGSAFMALALMVVVQTTIGAVQFLQRGGALERRITGTASHVMSLAGLLLPVSLFALVWGIERKRWLAVTVGAIGAIGLSLSLTRSAWIGWIAGIVLYLLLRRPRWLAVLVPAMILLVTLSPIAIFGRLVSSFDPNQSSNLDRIRMAQAGVEMIRDHPLLGLGPGNVKPSYPIYRLPDAPRFSVPHLHSNPIQIFAERGVVALFAYALLILLILLDCLKGIRLGGDAAARGLGVGAAVIGMTVAGLFEFNFGDSEVLMGLLAVAALGASRPREQPAST